MSGQRFAASTLLAAATLAALGLAADPARTEDRVQLMILAQPGDSGRLTLSVDVGVLVFTGAEEPLVVQLRNQATQAVAAEAVADDGTVTWRSRLVRVSAERDGEPLLHFDADDPDADATLGGLQVVMQQETDGRLRDFRVVGAQPEVRARIEATLEESIERSVLMYPREPIAIGSSWKAGRRDMPFPGIGRVEYQLLATLVAIHDDEDGAWADVRLDAADARFVPDEDSKHPGRLAGFRMQGDAQYDVQRGYMRWQDSYLFMSILAREKSGETVTLQAYGRVSMQEERD